MKRIILVIILLVYLINLSLWANSERSGARLTVSTAYINYLNSTAEKIPYSYGLQISLAQSLDSFIGKHKVYFPFLEVESSFLNYSGSSYSLRNFSYNLGPLWKIPLGLRKLRGRFCVALLPGQSLLSLKSGTNTYPVGAAFSLNSYIAYGIQLKKIGIFLRNTYQYIYDIENPLWGVGINLGVDYKLY